MNISTEIISRSAKGLKTTVKGFAARLGEKIGIVQKEVQECAGKSAQEIAEMTSKKDVAQIAATNVENAAAQTTKKLSFAERFKNFKAKLLDKLTSKVPIKDKSQIEQLPGRYYPTKSAPGVLEKSYEYGNYYTNTGRYSINWTLSKNPIKRFFGLNTVGSVYVNDGSRTLYKKAPFLGYIKSWDGMYDKRFVLTIPAEARYYARPLP